jgi:hypothetical protein
MRPAHRPSDYTQEIADHICEQIADGKSLRSICREDDMPNKATVFRWLGKHETFRDQYARAMEARADSHADDIVDIADDPTLDPNDKRVRIDARKWTASKLKAKVYGDKQLIGSDPENPLPTAPVIDASKLSAQALREVIEAANEADKG